MNDKFDNQKETLTALSHEISLLQQQVKYLLRNEKAAELLDLDVLMNRTHTIYDMICTISVNENDEEQDFDIDPEALTALFGGMDEEVESEEVESGEVESGEVESEEVESGKFVETPIHRVSEDDEEVESEKFVETPIHRVSEEEPIAEEQPEPQQEGDEFGLFFRFEDIPVKEVESEEVESEEVESGEVESGEVESGEVESGEVESGKMRFDSAQRPEEEEVKDDVVEEIDGKTVHFMEETPIEEIPEKDRIEGEDLITDDPFKMPAMEDGSPSYGSFFEKDDMGFEISSNETLGESMIDDDNSLNARFQHAPVGDLKKAIGLNDKFLFVNELFGGSMEKYNKSIDNLNDLKTLNGAMIYLNELKVELQWNSSNEAYKKLWTLVAQKFENQ